MKRSKNMYNDSGLIVVMILLMLVSFCIFFLAYDTFKWTKYPYIEAKLDSCGYAEKAGDDELIYDAVFKYKIKGRTYEIKDVAKAKECEKGATRRVTYNPNNPEDSRKGNQLVKFILLIIFGLSLFIIPLITIIESIRDKGKNKKEG